MIREHLRHLITLALTGTLLFTGSAQAKIVCWTNSEGVRECGNAVPPEYAQQETRTIDKRGITTEVKERAKTPEELAAERARRAEEERLAAEEEKRRQVQEAYDRVLLSTYLDEEDIVRSRERQSSAINATIDITRTTIDKLQEKLNGERKRAADYERQGKPLPERLQEDISSLQGQIDAKNSYIRSKEQEKEVLHKKYEADMVRFRELKANGAKLR
ncbi:MAG: DUF4124 domain-containing protein [Gammaproteobacteria bacterium]|nr:DUF4124 domain-containing protein [Gammaproteobacteria bacterium]